MPVTVHILDVPKGAKHHPFEPSSRRFFVLRTSGRSVSRLARTARELEPLEVLGAFPSGYTQLWILERVYLERDGQRFDYPCEEDRGSFYVLGSDGAKLHPKGNQHDTKFDTVTAAKEALEQMRADGRDIIIAKLHGDIYWH